MIGAFEIGALGQEKVSLSGRARGAGFNFYEVFFHNDKPKSFLLTYRLV